MTQSCKIYFLYQSIHQMNDFLKEILLKTNLQTSLSELLFFIALNLMKPKVNILQKILLIIFYIESAAYLDRFHMLALSSIVFALCLYFEGAKPYWPVFLLILVLEYLELSTIQTIIMIVTAFLLNAIKLYEIPIPGKGQFNSGYKASKFQNVDFCIFYPTKEKGKRANWFPNKDYFKTLYEIFYVDPQTKRMPFFIFAFLVSFLTKVTMPCIANARLYEDSVNKNKKFKIVVFSHGLGANMNAYCSICGWFASHGYLVVSVQHSHDKICVDHTKLPTDDVWKIRDFLYMNRNRDIKIRVAEMSKVVRAIVENKFFQDHLDEEIFVEEIHLAGQSYGGGTALQTMAELIKQKKDHHIKSVITLDPWMFPLDQDAYTIIKDKNILLLNSQNFWENKNLPYIYELQKRFAMLKNSNKQTLKALLITKMNHLDQCDMAFVFGNIMEFFRKNSHYYLSEQILQLNLVLISMFLEGQNLKQMIELGNQFCKENELNQVGFSVMQEFRVERQMMLDFQKSRQPIIEKLMTKKSFLKRLFWH